MILGLGRRSRFQRFLSFTQKKEEREDDDSSKEKTPLREKTDERSEIEYKS